MASDAQIKASRLNGSRSRGPVTPEGRARSSVNAVKHGLHSRTVVLNNESQEMYERLKETYFAELLPETQIEKDMALTVVNAMWRLNRVISVETASIDLEIDQQRPVIEGKFASIDQPTRAAIAYAALAAHGPLPMLSRTEARLRRTIERTLDRLERLQDKRKSQKCKNEPEA